MAYYVYLLKCADATLYCGYTNNLEKRTQSHNQGKGGAKYTRSRRPVRLVFVKRFYKLSNALRFEIQVKKLSRTEKQGLIDDFRKANLKKLRRVGF